MKSLKSINNKKSYVLIVILFFVVFGSPATAATLLTKVDFEQGGWESNFEGAWTNYAKVVTANPHAGNHCLRGNLLEGRVDPITGLPGYHSGQLSLVGNHFVDYTPHGVFIRYWRRFDDATWQGSEPGHGKAEYLIDVNVGVGAYYTRMAWNKNDFDFSWNGGFPQEWHKEHWGGLKVYLGNSDLDFSKGSDGKWHKIEYYIDYDEDYIMFWFDGHLLYGIGSQDVARDGKIPIYPDFKLRAVGFFYVHEAQVEDSTDGAGYACGWQLDDIEVWDGLPDDMSGGTPADNPPSVSITTPTSGNAYSTSNASITISGNASDDNGISSIAWSNNRGGNGTATNSSGDWSDWSINGVALQEGENVITITATDTNNQSATDTITVTYTSDMVQAWSANDQTNDSDWKDSSVTYCVRLLIEGAQITRSGNQIMLGFKGRSSGDYTIRKVSIAERDPNGGEGNVIDSTWIKVTFDGKSTSTWDTDEITIPAGQEKLSDPVKFTIEPGKDYYVTFKIVSPSVYLNPPSTYKELYFWTDDHASDIDWSGNGHTTTQDYHALSSIYILSSSNDSTPPTAPRNFSVE